MKSADTISISAVQKFQYGAMPNVYTFELVDVDTVAKTSEEVVMERVVLDNEMTNE